MAKVPGFRVAARRTRAAEALARIADSPVDLILLDHYLPDENGLTVVRELRQLGHHTDVIMVTAARDVATVQAAMRHGALQYLVKPFTFAGLRAKLEAYAALRRTLEGGGEAEQEEVDRIFGALSAPAPSPPTCPRATRRPPPSWSARCCAPPTGRCPPRRSRSAPGVSRQTAQRYLKLPGAHGPGAAVSLRYGETGRPEHRYAWAISTARPDAVRRPVRPADAPRRSASRARRPQTAPAPVSARTSVSACLASSGGSAEVTVPIQPARKPSGMETRPGFSSGKTWKSTPGKSASGLPETTGESTTSSTAGTSPPYTDQTAPRVVKLRQNSE